ncbi:MAG: hypothetical protein J0I09_00015 [Sphingobacteriia bacterium]|nr:hypothetical protein [Sphingobacteriia bacterium]
MRERRCLQSSANIPSLTMRKLTPQEQQSELKRHKEILFATIDYILQNVKSENLDNDAFKTVEDYYRKQKLTIEKYFQEHKLALLKQRLQTLTKIPLTKADLHFNNHIKQTTGYEIDIFQELQTRIQELIRQNKITNEKQLNDVAIKLALDKQKSSKSQTVDILKSMVLNYATKAKTSK